MPVPERPERGFHEPACTEGLCASRRDRPFSYPESEVNMAVREKAEIIDAEGLRRIITRIAHEIVERNKGTEDLVLVGVRRRGVPLAERIAAKITEFESK